MSASSFTVTYTDGTSEVVARRPIHWVRAERTISKEAGAQETVLATLWAAATGGTTGIRGFEEWAEKVESWDVADAADADPPEPEPAGSQT